MVNQEKLKYWQGLIKKYEKSELTLTEWCAKNKTSRGTYHYWKKQLQLKDEASSSVKSDKVSFVKIETISVEPIKPIKLQVKWKDLQIEISSKEDANLAAELIKNLQYIC